MLEPIVDDDTIKEPLNKQQQTVQITFKNPTNREVKITGDMEHRHKQEYFDAIQYIRRGIQADTNIIIGEAAHAVARLVRADNPEPLHNFVSTLMASSPPMDHALNPFTNQVTTERDVIQSYHEGYQNALNDIMTARKKDSGLNDGDIQELVTQNEERKRERLCGKEPSTDQ